MNKKQMKQIEKLQKLKESGALTEDEFKVEKEKILNSTVTTNKNSHKASIKKIGIILGIVVLVIVIGVVIFFVIKNKNNTEPTSSETNSSKIDNQVSIDSSSNIQAGHIGNMSFGNYNSDDENFDETQKNLIEYFNNNYMHFSVKDAQKYPQMYKGAKVCTYVRVVKVLNSTDEEYEVVAADLSQDGWKAYYDSVEQIPNGNIICIKGKQLNERLMGGEKIYVYGTYINTENREIDGKSYMISNVTADFIQGYHYDSTDRYELLDPKFSFDVIKNIAEYIFGKDIKVSKDTAEYADEGQEINYYNVILDDQSNLNFKSFDMYDDQGMIVYDNDDNNLDINTTKKLFISADFQHYIVTTYDKNTNHVYIDYFDRDRKKLWSREFDYKSTKAYVSPMDYNNDTLACVVDNDLHIIDLNTGEDKVSPIIVGEKIKVLMINDGIILIGDNSKDTIMKVDYYGNIMFKKDITFEGQLKNIDYSQIQLINDKLSIYLNANFESAPYTAYKLVLMSKDGDIESISNDLSYSF